MPSVLQFRRLTTSELSSTVGQEGELFVDTTKKTITVHDGVTSGGTAVATESFVSSTLGGYVTTSALSGYVTTSTFDSTIGDIDAALAAINGE